MAAVGQPNVVRVVVVDEVAPQPSRLVQSVRVQVVDSVSSVDFLVTLQDTVQRRTVVRSDGLQSSSSPSGTMGMGHTGPTHVGG